MNLSNKPDTIDNNENKWKAKYLQIVYEQEQLQKSHQAEQELLCKTIIRLSLAAKGLDRQLDPYLEQIRNLLKKGIKSTQLQGALDQFSNALLQFADSDNQPKLENTDLLFEFLIRFFPAQKRPLQLLRKKYNNVEFPDSNELFTALSDITKLAFFTGSENKIDPPSAGFHEADHIDTHDVVLQFQEILSSLEIPPEFEESAASLSERFKLCASFDVLKAIMNDYIDLLQAIKRHQQSEHKDMAVFLSNLTEQLNELDLTVTGASVATRIAATKRNLLDQSVSAQMFDLQRSSEIATSLEPLKRLINTRLQSIAQEIHEHAKNEDQQRIETEQRLNELTQKISILDAESKELKKKLIIAHSKATRDSLTGLPNRLAYEENVSIEISRWKRYHTPLTMVMWDIDFFKKINDTFGHKAGDKTLTIIANLLTDNCRETDFVARFGGEEFIMLLPNTDGASALILSNKIRTIIDHAGFNSGGNRIRITISCGLSQFKEGDTAESAFERADHALYQAKAGGRNLCVLN